MGFVLTKSYTSLALSFCLVHTHKYHLSFTISGNISVNESYDVKLFMRSVFFSIVLRKEAFLVDYVRAIL